MKFSVIVPVYNADNTLCSAISGLIDGQKCCSNGNCEVLLIENGSTDRTAALCDELAKKFEAVTAFHEGPTGAYAARRIGMTKAKGDWLLFMDADDCYVPGGIEKLSDFIDSFAEYESAPDLILYDWEKIQSGNTTVRHYLYENKKLYEGKELEAFYSLMCDGDSLNALWNKCVKRSLIQGMDKKPEVFLNHGEDLLQTAELIDRARSIAYLSETVYKYNNNDSGITGTYSDAFLTEQEYAWSEFDGYVEQWEKAVLDSIPGEMCNYKELVVRRKALTCVIAVKTLIFSSLRGKEKAAGLADIMESDFYKKYASFSLPEWVSEEDMFIRGIMDGNDAQKKLLALAFKSGIKSWIKGRIRK